MGLTQYERGLLRRQLSAQLAAADCAWRLERGKHDMMFETMITVPDMSGPSVKDNILVDDGGHAVLNDFGLSSEIHQPSKPEC
jgi:hypothetical protein